MDVGDEQIYRLRDDAPSERVRIVAIQAGKQSHRHDVEFLGGDKAGHPENVPGTRLRGPWSGVREYDQVMTNWQRLAVPKLTDHEEAAVEIVFELLIPSEIAEWEWRPVEWVTSIHDPGVSARTLSVRHEALFVRTEVRDRRRFIVVAVG